VCAGSPRDIDPFASALREDLRCMLSNLQILASREPPARYMCSAPREGDSQQNQGISLSSFFGRACRRWWGNWVFEELFFSFSFSFLYFLSDRWEFPTRGMTQRLRMKPQLRSRTVANQQRFRGV